MLLKNFIINEAKAFLGPPRQNYKILFLNILGLQIVRYFLAYIKYEFFKKKDFKTSEGISLDHDGYAIVNNFLPKHDFENILNICTKIETENKFKVKHYGHKQVHSYDFFNNQNNDDEEAKYLKDLFIKKLNESSFMHDVAKIIKIKKMPIKNLSYEKIIAKHGFVDKGDIDAEFHSDRFYPCIKMFFYLNDNKIENGAFEYIKKSNNFSIHRLIHEYWYSIFISGNFFFLNLMKLFGYEIKNERVTFVAEKIDKIFGKDSIIACEAPKNSLVICNNKGFHKRGRLTSNTTRLHLRINLYDLQISKAKSSMFYFAKKFKNNYLA